MFAHTLVSRLFHQFAHKKGFAQKPSTITTYSPLVENFGFFTRVFSFVIVKHTHFCLCKIGWLIEIERDSREMEIKMSHMDIGRDILSIVNICL